MNWLILFIVIVFMVVAVITFDPQWAIVSVLVDIGNEIRLLRLEGMEDK